MYALVLSARLVDIFQEVILCLGGEIGSGIGLPMHDAQINLSNFSMLYLTHVQSNIIEGSQN